MQVIEYEDKYLEDVKDLLVELEEYIVSIDKDHLDQVHPEYRASRGGRLRADFEVPEDLCLQCTLQKLRGGVQYDVGGRLYLPVLRA